MLARGPALLANARAGGLFVKRSWTVQIDVAFNHTSLLVGKQDILVLRFLSQCSYAAMGDPVFEASLRNKHVAQLQEAKHLAEQESSVSRSAFDPADIGRRDYLNLSQRL